MGQFCQWLDFAHGSQAWCPNPNQGGLLYSIFLLQTFELVPRDGARESVFSLRNSHSVMFKSYLFVTPWTVAHQALLSMGFSRQEYWTGLPCSSPGDLPDPGIEPASSYIYLYWQAGSSPLAPSGKPQFVIQLFTIFSYNLLCFCGPTRLTQNQPSRVHFWSSVTPHLSPKPYLSPNKDNNHILLLPVMIQVSCVEQTACSSFP